MQYVVFGNSGMKVSRFVLGSMMFGRKIDQETTCRVVDEAIDNGVNFIDTADSYGDSEKFLGNALNSEKRERVYLTTKVFSRFCRDRRITRNCRTNIINSLERSLKRLKTDYIDLYQLHHPDPEAPIGETLMTLDNLVRQGKIRYYGVSNHYAWQMAYMLGLSKCQKMEPMISLQADYNILDRQIERETISFLKKFNIALMCYSPLCGGILTGKYMGQENDPPEGSRAKEHSGFRSYVEDREVQEILRNLKEIRTETGLNMNQLSVLWLLSKPQVTTVILGGSKPEHFTQLYEIADETISEEVVKKIDEISDCRVWQKFMNQPMVNGFGMSNQR